MRRLRRFGFNRIKEGFDQLPTAICFFDSRGSIVLCNRQMYRLSHSDIRMTQKKEELHIIAHK